MKNLFQVSFKTYYFEKKLHGYQMKVMGLENNFTVFRIFIFTNKNNYYYIMIIYYTNYL